MNNISQIKIIKSFIILVIIISYIYFKNYATFNTIYLDEMLIANFQNKQIWVHFYGSLAAFACPIVEYNFKADLHLHGDLITEIVALKKVILNLSNSNYKDSDFFDYSENAKQTYRTFVEDYELFRSYSAQFRILLRSNIMPEATFQGNFLIYIEVYLKFLRSLIRVLELAPNTNDPDVLEVIKKSGEFVQRLEKFLKS